MDKKLRGVSFKKWHGQNFLRDPAVAAAAVAAVHLTDISSVMEIGCGDGFLTAEIMHHPLQRLWTFEIDSAWAQQVREKITDNRLTVFTEDVMQINWHERLSQYAPWTLIANLPYHLTFPILYQIHAHRELFNELVVMVQEEVAQKLLKQSGRNYGYTSLFFQHYFDMRLLIKVPPEAFTPAPRVYSRLLYIKPREQVVAIPYEADFWDFIRYCFAQPRRILRNNLLASKYAYLVHTGGTHWDALRAQQMSMSDFRSLWGNIVPSYK